MDVIQKYDKDWIAQHVLCQEATTACRTLECSTCSEGQLFCSQVEVPVNDNDDEMEYPWRIVNASGHVVQMAIPKHT